MCEPVSAGIMAGAVVAGTAYNIYSARRQGKLAKKAGERNAVIARQAAADAEQLGELEASKVRSAGVRDMAKAKATMLAQGQYAEGSGLQDLLVGMATNIEMDAETIKNNAARQAWGLRNQADTSLYEGEIAAFRSKQEAIGAGISGAAQVASIYGMSRKPGGKGTDGLQKKAGA